MTPTCYGSGPTRPRRRLGDLPGGLDPPTVAARRAEFLGWTGSQIAPSVLMDAALKGTRGRG